MVEERLLAQGANYQVRNAGVDNDTSAAALARLNRALVPNTKILIVAIGMNDFKVRRPIPEITSNIGAIIRQAKARGIEVLLCAFEQELYGPPYDVQFKNMYTTLATQHGVAIVPNLMAVVWNDPRTYTTDGIHPNARGARQMAYKILPCFVRCWASAALLVPSAVAVAVAVAVEVGPPHDCLARCRAPRRDLQIVDLLPA